MCNELDVINWLLDNDMIYRGRTRLPISSGLNSIKHTLQRNKMVLDALKNYLHIIPMDNGNDVIGIGCPSNEDVIEPNDYGYDIIKEWLKDDKSVNNMTNREWLNSLSNEDFVKWCLDGDIFNFENSKHENPTPRLQTIKYTYTSASGGLFEWLGKERDPNIEKDKSE